MIPDITLIFMLDGKRLTLRFRDLPLSVWSELKRHFGFTPGTIINACTELDVEAFAAIIWLERRQHDRRLQWATVQRELEVTEVEFELIDSILDGVSTVGEDVEPVEPDPTSAG